MGSNHSPKKVTMNQPHRTEAEKQALADEVIEFLNELVLIDRRAMHYLVEDRVVCNDAMADHPTLQVSAPEGAISVGMLGIINGFIGVDERGFGYVAARYDDDDGKLAGFSRIPSRIRTTSKTT